MTDGKNRIRFYGPKVDGSYWVEFRTDTGESLVISVMGSEAAVLKHFQQIAPYGVVVDDVTS